MLSQLITGLVIMAIIRGLLMDLGDFFPTDLSVGQVLMLLASQAQI